MRSSAIADHVRSRSAPQLKASLHIGVRQARAAVTRRPPIVTIVFILCLVVVYVRLQVGGQLPTLRFVADAYSPRAVVQGHLRLLATSTLMDRDVFMLISISVSLLATLGTYEVMAGHMRAAALAGVAAILGPASVTGALGLLVGLGSTWADSRLATLGIGASAIIAMSSGAIAGLVRNRRLTAGLLLFLLGGLLVHHRIADWEHLLVFPWGYLIGRYLGRGKRQAMKGRPIRRAVIYVVAGGGMLALGLAACSRLLPPAPVYRTATGSVLSAPRIVDRTYPAPSLGGRPRRVLVLLPAGYDNMHQRYPVVELLDGHPGRPEDLFSLGDVQGSATAANIAPFIALIPDGNGPRVEDSWYANVPAQQMGTATSSDLRRWALNTLRTNGSWSYAGLSSGGYGAAYLPLIDTEPVHAVCGLSGYYSAAHVPIPAHSGLAARRKLSPLNHPDKAPTLTFLAYGKADAYNRHDAYLYAHALERNHHHVIIKAYPGKHQWTVWRPAFRDCFATILPATHGH